MNYPWFRMYSEVLHDKKLARVSFQTKQPKALVLGLWVTILSLANDSPERGKLLISDGLPLTLDEILFEAGLDESCISIINEFIRTNMLVMDNEVLEVCHWDDRQFASDHSRERVQRYRERKKKASSVTETGNDEPCNVTVTPQDTDTDTETEISSLDDSGETPQQPERVETENLPEVRQYRLSSEFTLEPDTPETTFLFEKLNGNRRAKKRNNAKQFKTLEQKKKCLTAAARLGHERFELAVTKGLEKGLTDIASLVNWVSRWELETKTKGYHQNGSNGSTQINRPEPPKGTGKVFAGLSAAFKAGSRGAGQGPEPALSPLRAAPDPNNAT